MASREPLPRLPPGISRNRQYAHHGGLGRTPSKQILDEPEQEFETATTTRREYESFRRWKQRRADRQKQRGEAVEQDSPQPTQHQGAPEIAPPQGLTADTVKKLSHSGTKWLAVVPSQLSQQQRRRPPHPAPSGTTPQDGVGRLQDKQPSLRSENQRDPSQVDLARSETPNQGPKRPRARVTQKCLEDKNVSDRTVPSRTEGEYRRSKGETESQNIWSPNKMDARPPPFSRRMPPKGVNEDSDVEVVEPFPPTYPKSAGGTEHRSAAQENLYPADFFDKTDPNRRPDGDDKEPTHNRPKKRNSLTGTSIEEIPPKASPPSLPSVLNRSPTPSVSFDGEEGGRTTTNNPPPERHTRQDEKGAQYPPSHSQDWVGEWIPTREFERKNAPKNPQARHSKHPQKGMEGSSTDQYPAGQQQQQPRTRQGRGSQQETAAHWEEPRAKGGMVRKGKTQASNQPKKGPKHRSASKPPAYRCDPTAPDTWREERDWYTSPRRSDQFARGRRNTRWSAWKLEEWQPEWNTSPQNPQQEGGWQPPEPPSPPSPPYREDTPPVESPISVSDGEQQASTRPQSMFPNGVDLYQPPSDLFERSAHYAQYDLDVRAQTLYLLRNDALTLKMSLRIWLVEMMHQATDRAATSTRRFGHMLYSGRGLKIREFTELMSAENLSATIFDLAGAQIGSTRTEHELLLQESTPPRKGGGGRGPRDTGANTTSGKGSRDTLIGIP